MFYIFNSIFGGQFYSPGASTIMGLYYCHIKFDFCEMNSVFEGIFRVLLFRKYFLGFSVGGKVLVLGRSETPNSADPCL